MILFSRKEMGKLAHALVCMEERRHSGSNFFTEPDEAALAHDEKFHRRFNKDEPFDEGEWRKSRIIYLVQHLWVANQVAYHLQYPKEEMNGLEMLEEEDICNGALCAGYVLYRELCSLRYNLYTNGGSVFLPPADLEKLNHLIARLADDLVRAQHADR